jgi:CO/xanthine dehydrogenase FAD-binding subunit
MRAYLPAYELKTPANLAEALNLLGSPAEDWKAFAGGTDLMVLLEAGKLPLGRYLSLWHLQELRGIQETPQHLTLGSLTTFSEIQRHRTLQREYSLLCQAAGLTGAVAIQNRATLGGNIANASPAADSPPALLVYDADVELLSAKGNRWLPYHAFHTGYKETQLQPGELISRVRLPRSPLKWKEGYRKVGTRKAQAISKVCFAARMRVDEGTVADIRIALGGVAPVPLRCFQTEVLLRGANINTATVKAAREMLSAELSPIDDFRSTQVYRRTIAGNLLEKFLVES